MSNIKKPPHKIFEKVSRDMKDLEKIINNKKDFNEKIHTILPIYKKNGDINCYVLIDKKDLQLLNKFVFRLSLRGYTKCKVDRKDVYMHRLIMKEANKSVIIDHINNNPFDNRRKNLRRVTLRQNAMNRSKKKNSSSKYKGVYKREFKNSSKFYVYIKHDGKKLFLGKFDNELEAVEIYNKFAKKFFKQYANINKF